MKLAVFPWPRRVGSEQFPLSGLPDPYLGWPIELYHELDSEATARGGGCRFFDIESGDIPAVKAEYAQLRPDLTILFNPTHCHRSDLCFFRESTDGMLVLWETETPMILKQRDRKENRSLFDAVVTYSHRELFCPQVLTQPIPYRHRFEVDGGKDFGERKFMICIATNCFYGPFGLLSSNLRSFWRVSSGQGWTPSRLRAFVIRNQSTYDLRRKIVWEPSDDGELSIDVAGYGWSGEKTSWLHRIFPAVAHPNTLGPIEDKDRLLRDYRFNLVVENCLSDSDYVSEKIFDSMACGVVPVYLGAENIKDYVPESCFVDVRDFESPSACLEFCRRLSSRDWEEYRKCIRNYCSSQAADVFSPKIAVRNLFEQYRKWMAMSRS